MDDHVCVRVEIPHLIYQVVCKNRLALGQKVVKGPIAIIQFNDVITDYNDDMLLLLNDSNYSINNVNTTNNDNTTNTDKITNNTISTTNTNNNIIDTNNNTTNINNNTTNTNNNNTNIITYLMNNNATIYDLPSTTIGNNYRLISHKNYRHCLQNIVIILRGICSNLFLYNNDIYLYPNNDELLYAKEQCYKFINDSSSSSLTMCMLEYLKYSIHQYGYTINASVDTSVKYNYSNNFYSCHG